MNAGNAKHDYHLADPSPWPFLGALSAFIMVTGAVIGLNGKFDFIGIPPFVRPWIFGGGAVLTLASLAGWWRDVIVESVRYGEHKPVVKLSFRFSMVLFLVIETVFFAALTTIYFGSALFGGAAWPPAGLIPPDPWRQPLLATLVMALSVSAAVWARRAVCRGDKSGAVLAISAAAGLSAIFVALLIYGLAHAPFGFGFDGARMVPLADPAHVNMVSLIGAPSAIFSSVFFLVLGFFALRSVVGVALWTVAVFRALAGHLTPERHFGLTAAAWYWYFGAALWLFLYISIYVMGYALAFSGR
jgi:cytochrome c oxidase subunit III